MKRIKWLLAMVVAMVMNMSMVSFAGVYGNTNEECFKNPEFRKAVENFYTTILVTDGNQKISFTWSDDQMLMLCDIDVADQSKYKMDLANILKPNGDIYEAAYWHNADFTATQDNLVAHSYKYEMTAEDYNEFANYVPVQ